MSGLLGFDPYQRLADTGGQPAKAANPAKADPNFSNSSNSSSGTPSEAPVGDAERGALGHAGQSGGDGGAARQRGAEEPHTHRARASAVIERCRAVGVSLRLAKDGLRVGRTIADHHDLAGELRAYRYELITELRAREGLCFLCGELAPPASTMLSGEPVHLDCLDRAVLAVLGDWGFR